MTGWRALCGSPTQKRFPQAGSPPCIFMPGSQQKHERHLKCVPGALGCGGIHPPKQGEAGVRPVPASFFPRDPAVLAADVPGSSSMLRRDW